MRKMTEWTNRRLLKAAIRIEKDGQLAYLCFARFFSRLPEVAAFWLALSRDEKKHAETLTAVIRKLSPEQCSRPAGRDLARKMDQTRLFLKKNPAEGIKNLDEAFEFSHALEFTEVVPLFRMIAQKFITDREEVNAVLDELQEHQRKLIDFDQRFGGPEWREAIPARDNF